MSRRIYHVTLLYICRKYLRWRNIDKKIYTPFLFSSGEAREVKVPEAVQAAAAALLSGSREFTVMATLQQEDRNAGTILAFSRGNQRYLELQSSGRKDEIRLHYIHSGAVHVETFPYRIADQRWHKVGGVSLLYSVIGHKNFHKKISFIPAIGTTALSKVPEE